MAKFTSYKSKVDSIEDFNENYWKIAEGKAKEKKKTKNFEYTFKIYKDLTWRKKKRIVFDKDKLMFRVNREVNESLPDNWDYSVHLSCIQLKTEKNPLGKKPEKNILIRTGKKLASKHTETYADFIHFRVGCITPDEDGNFGTEQSINFSIASAKLLIEETKKEYLEFGMKTPSWELETRDRSEKVKKPTKARTEFIESLKQLSFTEFCEDLDSEEDDSSSEG